MIKIKKFNKYSNDLVCDSLHNLNKDHVPDFNEISSIDSKADRTNTFYKELLKLNTVKIQNGNTEQKHNCVKKCITALLRVN